MSKVDVVDGASGARRGASEHEGHGDMASRVRRRFSRADDELDKTSKLSRDELDAALASASAEEGDESAGSPDEGGETRAFVSISLDEIDKAGREEREAARRERLAREEAERAAREAEEARIREEEEAARRAAEEEEAAARAAAEASLGVEGEEGATDDVGDGPDDGAEPDMSGMTLIDGRPIEEFGSEFASDAGEDADDEGADEGDDGEEPYDDELVEDDEDEGDGHGRSRLGIVLGVLGVVLVALVGVGVWLYTKPAEEAGSVGTQEAAAAKEEPKVKVSGVYFSDGLMAVTFDPAGNDRLNLSVTPQDASGSAVRGDTGGALFGELRWSSDDSSAPTVSVPMTEDQFSQVESLKVEVVGADFDDSSTASALGDARREVAAAARAREVEEADTRREELRQKRLDEEAAAAAKKKAEEEEAKRKEEEAAKKKAAEEEAKRKAEEAARNQANSNANNNNNNNANNNSNSNNGNTNNNNSSSNNGTRTLTEAERNAVERLSGAGGSSTGKGAVIDTSAMKAYLLESSGDTWTVRRTCDVYQDFGQTGTWDVVDVGRGPASAACVDGSYDHLVILWRGAVDYIVEIDGHEAVMYDDSYYDVLGICGGPDMRNSALAHASDGLICLPSGDATTFFEGLPVGSRVVVV